MRTVLTTAQRNARSLSFGSEEAARPHSLTREVDDLRNDIEDAFVAIESGANLPIIGNLTGSIDNGETGTNSLTINGSNLLANRVQASVVIADITFSAVLPGTDGNDIDIVIVVGDPNDNLSVSDTDNTVTITLGADGDGNPDDVKNTAELVIAAVNNGSALINAADSEDGADPVSAAVASTSLSGGTGRGLVATAFYGSTSSELTISSVSSSEIVFTDAQLPNLTAGDMVGIVLSSHTAQSNVAHIIVA